jgi:hypothetical protein
MMTLEQWRVRKKLSYGKLAKLLGASHASVVSRWCRDIDDKDRMIPKPPYMEAIYRLTDGSVQPNDFYLRRD